MGVQDLGKLGKGAVLPAFPPAVDHHQSRAIPRFNRMLRNQLDWQVELELRGEHVAGAGGRLLHQTNFNREGATNCDEWHTILVEAVRRPEWSVFSNNGR